MAERRWNPLTGEWVIVSTRRGERPWQGAHEARPADHSMRWQADCYLCPRNTRVSGAVNPDYHGPFVFTNDFPALDDTPGAASSDPLLLAESVTGACRVLCYSERHDATLASLTVAELAGVVEVWRAELSELGKRYAWVQVFENKGEVMGCSSPHPHGQIWAMSAIPTIVQREDDRQRRYEAAAGGNLLLEYVARELGIGERVVVRNDRWAAVIPFWATWPFEILLLPSLPRPSFDDLDADDRIELARILASLLPAYDRLFGVSFPYSMGWHGRARSQGPHWQLHAHFYPPLLRSADVRKFMVGFEMLAESQRDFSPETAAARLRDLVRS
jgi:UDPglucose--hexose-1-phosphate uridylyltransferase